MQPSPPELERAALSRLGHEMSNSLAYVTTNLSVLAEELEGSERLQSLVADALEGSERLGDLVRQLRRASWETVPGGPAAHVRPARVLVIDDEPAILHAVQRALRQHEVVIAGSVADAVPELDRSFDVVLCDLVMPVRSGIDWFHAIQVDDPDLASRFVFMTGGGFSEETRSFLGATDNPVLQKPFDAKTLRWVIASRLAEHP